VALQQVTRLVALLPPSLVVVVAAVVGLRRWVWECLVSYLYLFVRPEIKCTQHETVPWVSAVRPLEWVVQDLCLPSQVA
jgi:hypothetical protein